MKLLLPTVFLLLSFNIQAQQGPTACFTGDSVNDCFISFTDLSLGNPTAWDWTFTGGTPFISTAQNPTNIMWTTQGTYTVQLTCYNAFGTDDEIKIGVVIVTANTCSFDTTIGTPCTLATGLEDLTVVNEPFAIYPNPTTGIITVQRATGEIQVYDLCGRFVLRSNKEQLDMSSYPKGIYMVRVRETVRKLVKQ